MTLPPTVKSEKNATHKLYRSSAYKLPVPILGEGIGAKGIFNLSVSGLIFSICKPGTFDIKNFENTPSIPPGRVMFSMSDLLTTPGGNSFKLKLVPKLATPPPMFITAL